MYVFVCVCVCVCVSVSVYSTCHWLSSCKMSAFRENNFLKFLVFSGNSVYLRRHIYVTKLGKVLPSNFENNITKYTLLLKKIIFVKKNVPV